MDTNVYKTKDLNEASYIYSQGIKLLKLEPSSKYYWFVFSDPQECSDLSTKYWSKTAEGNIKEFVDSLKTLKDLLFSQKGVF